MNNKELKEKFKFKIAISEIREESLAERKQKKYINKKLMAIACMLVIFTSGVAFAKDIENFLKTKFRLGNGVQTAIENGYIGINDKEIKYNYSEVTIYNENSNNLLEKFNAGLKINNFIMTDTALCLEIELKFDEKINQYKNLNTTINDEIDYYNFGTIELTDLFILDNDNKIIYSPSFLLEDKELFNEYCQKNNLNFTYKNFNENYINSIANCELKEIDKNQNIIKFVYTIQADKFPNSKKLNLDFKHICFTDNNGNKSVLTGNWYIELDVPEIMYNRNDIFYKVISCENNNFNIYMAKATEIGFEVGITINNINLPELPDELINPDTGLTYIFNSKEELLSISTKKDFEEMYIKYMNERKPIRLDGRATVNWESPTDGCYILDEYGNKYRITSNNTKKQNANFKYCENFDENGFSSRIYLNKFDFYDEFEITKYNATNIITLVIDFYGKPVKIKLQKVNN